MNRRIRNPGEGIPLEIDHRPTPLAPTKGAVVKTSFCGICRTDAEVWHHNGEFPVPEVLGHEISGLVHSIGLDAQSSIGVGDRVIVNALGGCRECEVCRAGSHLCRHMRSDTSLHYGFTRDGGYQEYVVVHDVALLLTVPVSIPMDVACLLPCSGLTSYSAVVSIQDSVREALRIKGMANVMVIGTGSLGLFAIYNVRGVLPPEVRVCAVDVNKNKLVEAEKAGAHYKVLWDTADDVDANVTKVTDVVSEKFDGCLDFVGSFTTVTSGLGCLDQNGTISVAGVQFNGGKIPIDMLELTIHNKRIQGIQCGSQKQLIEVRDLVAQKSLMPENIKHVKPEDVNDVFKQILTNESLNKYVITFEGK